MIREALGSSVGICVLGCQGRALRNFIFEELPCGCVVVYGTNSVWLSVHACDVNYRSNWHCRLVFSCAPGSRIHAGREAAGGNVLRVTGWTLPSTPVCCSSPNSAAVKNNPQVWGVNPGPS